MLLIVVKVVTVFLAALSISKSYLDFRKKQESQMMFLFWSIVWLAAAVIVVYPSLIDRLTIYTREKTITLGTFVSIAFIFMLYVVYRIYAKAARLEYQQTQLIRKLGLAKSAKSLKK